jgi:hypothetical protein
MVGSAGDEIVRMAKETAKGVVLDVAGGWVIEKGVKVWRAAKHTDDAVRVVSTKADDVPTKVDDFSTKADDIGTKTDDIQRNVDPPYDPRDVRAKLEVKYGDDVTSNTVPRSNSKNVKLANDIHKKTDVPFDNRGFPIFDKDAIFDTRLRSYVTNVKDRATHMRSATQSLKDAIKNGSVRESQFTPQQLKAINAGEEKIPGYTWHHHQDVGRMQLVKTDVHAQTGHVGGFDMWYEGN